MMGRYLTWAGGLVLGLGLLLSGTPANAVIKRLTPLSEFLQESQFIVSAVVEAVDPDKPSMVLTVADDLKDKAPFRRLPINLTGDSEAAKEKHTEQLLKRVAVKQPVVIFVQQRGKKFLGFGFSNGTWFQMIGEGDPVRWSLAHGEPYLRRTFKGTTDEMVKTVGDGLAGKAKPPEPDEKAEPGFGPEVKPEEKKEEQGALPGGPVFAVIPTGAIGGLIAILALLFPALFGGLALTMKRWIAALTVLSLNSTLICLWVWMRPALGDVWWATPLALWTLMTAITVIGIVWAWRRHLHSTPAGEKSAAPNRSEMIVLGVMSGLGLSMVATCVLFGQSLFDDAWSKPLLVMWVGFWTATAYALLLIFADRRGRLGRALPVEGVLLGTVGVASLALGVLTTKPALASAEPLSLIGDAAGTAGGGRAGGWKWEARERGVIYSSPAVTKDLVIAAAAHGGAFPFGRLYALDRATGRQIWSFDDDGEMKQVFSSPQIVDGRVYVGEGFHQDHDCKVYCLDAATGLKRWAFPTSSHTESSPLIVAGKVYFGAGDDGIFCVNTEDGKELWHYTKMHVDTSPALADGRLFVGSGVGDVYSDTAMLCLDAATGKELWRLPTDLPVWGSPTVAGAHVFFGLGNGDFTKSAEKPGGAVVCVEAATGRRVWEVKTPDGVLDRPAIDRHRVYFGSRDRHVYAVSRLDGTVAWKVDVGSPVVSSVALLRLPGAAAVSGVYALGSAGRLVCLDPETGGEDYVFDVTADNGGAQPELYSTPIAQVVGEGRQIVFGAGVSNFVSRAALVYCLEVKMPD